MKYLIVLAILLSTPIEARVHAYLDGKECTIKIIRYSGIDNYIYAVGDCMRFFDACREGSCKVEEIEIEDFTFKVFGAERNRLK